jgi:phenylpyruvate tautomerase PptA (4-oxalocrotonate tautomerase family)|tara:strand:+ start:863 stop:1309 length:447 start_codon:yes stop_codon:yes gene_type:complete
MPTYTVKYSNFNLSQKQKNLLANDISNIHSKFTGANTFFAQVIFQKNENNCHFMGGKLVKTKEIFLNGQIRSGRTLKVKKKLILGLRKILIKNTNLKKDSVWVYLEDLLPDQMIEYGEVLPKSGQENKWFNSLTPRLRKRLRKMEKRK